MVGQNSCRRDFLKSSRGRSESAIVTSDQEPSRESLGISTARPSATELAKELERGQLATDHEVAYLPVQQVELRIPRHELRNGYDLGIGS